MHIQRVREPVQGAGMTFARFARNIQPSLQLNAAKRCFPPLYPHENMYLLFQSPFLTFIPVKEAILLKVILEVNTRNNQILGYFGRSVLANS